MIKIDKDYCEYREDNDPNYPGGKAIDAPTSDSIEGTAWRDLFFNQINGFFQAAILDAYGTFEINGLPDDANNSEVLNALKSINAKITDALAETINKNTININNNYEEHKEILKLIENLQVRMTSLENSVFLDVTTNPFIIEFVDLDGINLINGNWNTDTQSLECTRYNDDIIITFNNLQRIKLIEGIWNQPYNQLEC